jgi:hypothetical protein
VSMFRKTVLTSAIIGAGLVTSAGAAFAGDAPSGDHHGSDHHSGHSTHHGSELDKSCVSGAGSGSKHAEGALAVGSVLDAPISSNLCNVLNDNGNGNGSGNKLTVGGSDSSVPGLPDLGGLLGGGTSATPSAESFQAAPAQAAPAQAAPVQQAAPASSVPAGTSTTPIQG